MELVDYLRVLRRRWRVVAACALVALLAGWITTPAQQPRQPVPVGTSFRATHTLLQTPDVQTPVNLELTRLFATTGDIPRRAAVRLGRPAEQGPVLATRVSATADVKVGSLALSVSGEDGKEAAAIANAFAVEIIENLRATLQRDRDAEQLEAGRLVKEIGDRVGALQAQIAEQAGKAPLLEAQRDAYLQNYSSAFARLQALSTQGAARSPLVTLEEAVPVPVVPSSAFTPPSSRTARVLLGGLLGLLLGIVLALVLERLDRRLRTREAIEDITSLPVVAEVPVLPRAARRDWSIQVVNAPASAAAEAYRSLRSAVMLVPSRPVLQQAGIESEWRTPQVLLVTSPLPADGKTTTVANLAACLAESGRQVLVLDCDFRNPTLHRYLGVPPGRGISDLLAGTSTAELAHVVRPSSVPGVRLVTSGTVTDHPGALLARAGGLLDAARSLADVVLIDAAPVLAANDATDLVPYVDAVVLVARCGRTSREHALRATELLARLAVPIAGTVLVGSNGSLGPYSGGTGLIARLRRRRQQSAVEPPLGWSPAETQLAGRRSRARHRSRTSGSPGDKAPVIPTQPHALTSPAIVAAVNDTGWPSESRHTVSRAPDAPQVIDLTGPSPETPEDPPAQSQIALSQLTADEQAE